MNYQSHHIVFAGGGTGGHLFPGLAVARRLADYVPTTRITFVGSGREFEREQVAAAGFDYWAVACRPLRWQAREMVSFAMENMAGYRAAKQFLAEERVGAVVALGGYASVPTARAAARWGVPLVLLEQNVVPGRATRWLSRRASSVCVSWAQTRSQLRCRCPVHLTGTPLRDGFGENPTSGALLARSFFLGDETTGDRHTRTPIGDHSSRRLLVLGGSGGAQALNENIPKALHKIRAQLASWQVVHQSGRRDYAATRTLYEKLALPVRVVDFIDEMPKMLAATELVIGRAGGTTLAELAATSTAALLVPYPKATDDHQLHNAQALAKAGAAVLLEQNRGTGRLDDRLAEVMLPLLARSDRRRVMSDAMRRFARPAAADEVATLVLRMLGVLDPQQLPKVSA